MTTTVPLALISAAFPQKTQSFSPKGLTQHVLGETPFGAGALLGHGLKPPRSPPLGRGAGASGEAGGGGGFVSRAATWKQREAPRPRQMPSGSSVSLLGAPLGSLPRRRSRRPRVCLEEEATLLLAALQLRLQQREGPGWKFPLGGL